MLVLVGSQFPKCLLTVLFIRDKARQENDTTLLLHTDRTNRNPSSVLILNLIPLASGDCSDLSHYCAEIVTLGLLVVSVSGGLPGRVPVIRREGAQTKRFGL